MLTYTYEEAKEVFISADTHFGHYNIIKYSHRPFSNIVEMNNTLIKNWNDTVAPDDTVYFLGDLCYGRFCGYPFEWLFKLNGQMTFIRGSHDRDMPQCLTRPFEILSIDGVNLYLVHNCLDAPKDFHGVIVHGHNHGKRSFYHPSRRKMNVSVEVTGYRPVSLDKVIEVIKNGEEVEKLNDRKRDNPKKKGGL